MSVGGGPPARSPHASLTARSDRSRSPARPRHHPRTPTTNQARVKPTPPPHRQKPQNPNQITTQGRPQFHPHPQATPQIPTPASARNKDSHTNPLGCAASSPANVQPRGLTRAVGAPAGPRNMSPRPRQTRPRPGNPATASPHGDVRPTPSPLTPLRGPRPRRARPPAEPPGRGTGSRTRSPVPRRGRSGSTADRPRARHTRRA